MSAPDFAVFPTAIGACAVAWGSGGICGASLPESDEAALRRRVARRWPDAAEAAPPPEVAAVIARVQALMDGARDDLADVPLDWTDVPGFDRGVLEICRAIPPGETLTYGDIARRLGDIALSRGVGQALGRNPFAPIVPCHRVLGADGKTGGFSGGAGVETKLAILTIERARTGVAPGLFDDDPDFGFQAPPPR